MSSTDSSNLLLVICHGLQRCFTFGLIQLEARGSQICDDELDLLKPNLEQFQLFVYILSVFKNNAVIVRYHQVLDDGNTVLEGTGNAHIHCFRGNYLDEVCCEFLPLRLYFYSKLVSARVY